MAESGQQSNAGWPNNVNDYEVGEIIGLFFVLLNLNHFSNIWKLFSLKELVQQQLFMQLIVSQEGKSVQSKRLIWKNGIHQWMSY